jgi:UDP-N-acetylmuramate--alanine ligase
MYNTADIFSTKVPHFIGIGGIGISAIAKMMLLSGKKVTGSDAGASLVTEKLARDGAQIFRGHAKENIPPDADCIIYTIAIPEDNPELVEAKARNLPLFTYPQALGALSEGKKTVAISGTHGKTTTTALTGSILQAGNLDPMVIVGSFLNKEKENFVAGSGDYLVVEACEYRRSFLNLFPHVLVITNIDTDHLDYYKDLADIQSAFREIALKVPTEGAVVCKKNDANLQPVIAGLTCNIIDYRDIVLVGTLKVPGAHNRENAQAAQAVGEFLGIDTAAITSVLENFTGTWRRGEYKGKTTNGALVYDDYAHHPTEVRAALQGFRELFPNKELTAVFQPHLYSRTKLLLGDFADALAGFNTVIIAPIYAAREKDDGTISGNDLAKEIQKKNNNVLYLETFSAIEEELTKRTTENSVVITIGAGDVYKIGESLV